MRHLIDPLDLTQQEITQLLDLADRSPLFLEYYARLLKPAGAVFIII